MAFPSIIPNPLTVIGPYPEVALKFAPRFGPTNDESLQFAASGSWYMLNVSDFEFAISIFLQSFLHAALSATGCSAYELVNGYVNLAPASKKINTGFVSAMPGDAREPM